MEGKITLITPPDIYENYNNSLLFVGMSETDQDQASLWLGTHAKDLNIDLNFYFYQGENNIPWLFYALSKASFTFVNLNTNESIINILGSYILGKPNDFYTCIDENLKALLSHINNNYVPNIDTFLKKVING